MSTSGPIVSLKTGGTKMLVNYLSKVAKEFVYERAKQFTGSSFGVFVRHDLAMEARKHTLFLPYDLKVRASVGQGGWASVPWVAFFDPLVTESATRGYYVVVLINSQAQTFTLSLNQGATEVYEEFGVARGREVLARRARDIADRLPDFASQFSEDAIQLGSTDQLPLGYEAGHSFGRTYEADRANATSFEADLRLMLRAYSELVSRGGTTPSEIIREAGEGLNIEEARKYVLSQRIERSPRVRRDVLAALPNQCQGCGLNPKIDYLYSGRIERTPLDVHHCTPLSSLREGETKRYRIPEDFLILCPTCHRMIHKQDDPSDIEELKGKIRFKLARTSSFSTF